LASSARIVPQAFTQRRFQTAYNFWVSTQTIAAEQVAPSPKLQPAIAGDAALFRVLAVVSFCHLLNDMVQSLLPSMYPILKNTFHLDFARIGLITLTYQITASLLQPVVGYVTDRRPMPYSLAVGMLVTLIGLVMLAFAPNFTILIIASCLIGVGSAVFHPESSRVSRMASGGRHGTAQAFFQVGGNAGTAIGPLLAAFVVLPHGQKGAIWFSFAALLGILLLGRVGRWYKLQVHRERTRPAAHTDAHVNLPRGKILGAMAVLVALIFSKYFYLASFSTFYEFYLINRFNVSVRNSEIYLFIFFAAVAAGTLIGGPVGDKIGRKTVIWCSILGVLPFSLILPHANLPWTLILSVIIGFVIASAFSAILVFAQELVPGKVGLISGLFFGVAFGMGGIGAAVLGELADHTSIDFVYKVCAFLPALGLLAGLLPDIPAAGGSRPASSAHVCCAGDAEA
jgi:FSR family fosmidomycin resistance protein-like MFS transporter